MKHLDLFSGIGGFAYAVDQVWENAEHIFCDNDKFCRQVLKKHWYNSKIYEDIHEVKNEKADIITGGFPCQDISIAGKGAGIAGKRSGLWKQMLRICKEVRPQFIIIENVSRLREKGLSVVLKDLSKIRYDAEWYCFRASDFFAPHRRERLFLIAYPRGNHSGGVLNGKYEIPLHKEWAATKNIRKWSEWKRWIISVMEDDDRQKNTNKGSGMDDGLSRRVDKIRVLGNAIVPQVAIEIMKAIKTQKPLF